MSDDSIIGREQALVEEFSLFDNWMDRYEYLIDLGRQLPEYAETERRDIDKVAGCQSQVWFQADERDGLLQFRAISDAAIVSGLIAVLLRLYNGQSPSAVLAYEPSFIQSLGLDQHLSPSRANGLHAMLGRIRESAQGALAA